VLSKVFNLGNHATTVSAGDIIENAFHKAEPQYLSKELMKLIDSGESSSPKAIQEANVCDFEAVSNFESGF